MGFSSAYLTRKRLLTPSAPSLPPVSELPVSFTRLLQDVVATQKEKVTLECELSRPVDVRWLKVFLPPLCFSLWASRRRTPSPEPLQS